MIPIFQYIQSCYDALASLIAALNVLSSVGTLSPAQQVSVAAAAGDLAAQLQGLLTQLQTLQTNSAAAAQPLLSTTISQSNVIQATPATPGS